MRWCFVQYSKKTDDRHFNIQKVYYIYLMHISVLAVSWNMIEVRNKVGWTELATKQHVSKNYNY
jgi:hypothetical protein